MRSNEQEGEGEVNTFMSVLFHWFFVFLVLFVIIVNGQFFIRTKSICHPIFHHHLGGEDDSE